MLLRKSVTPTLVLRSCAATRIQPSSRRFFVAYGSSPSSAANCIQHSILAINCCTTLLVNKILFFFCPLTQPWGLFYSIAVSWRLLVTIWNKELRFITNTPPPLVEQYKAQ